MGKMNTVARLRTWNEARLHIAKTFGFAGFVGDFWPERLGFNELAALQTVDVPEDLDAWQTALINSGLPVTIEKYERRYRYDTPGEIFEHKTLSAADFAVFLANQAEQPSRLIAVWFDAFGIARPKTETATGGANAKTESARTRLKSIAREIGEQWMKAERKDGRDPGGNEIAQHVEAELKKRDERGPRGDYWDWQTIKKEALKGITGRLPNGKRQKS
jgi:hypothetical protein